MRPVGAGQLDGVLGLVFELRRCVIAELELADEEIQPPQNCWGNLHGQDVTVQPGLFLFGKDDLRWNHFLGLDTPFNPLEQLP